MDDQVLIPGRCGNSSLCHRLQTDSEVHSASYLMGTGVLTPGVKRPGREADHSPPSTAEVKPEWSYTSTPQYIFMSCCLIKQLSNGYVLKASYLIKHGNNFTYLLTYLLTGIKFLNKGMKTVIGSHTGITFQKQRISSVRICLPHA